MRNFQKLIQVADIGIIDESVRHYWVNHKIIMSIQELPAAMFGIMEYWLNIKDRRP